MHFKTCLGIFGLTVGGNILGKINHLLLRVREASHISEKLVRFRRPSIFTW